MLNLLVAPSNYNPNGEKIAKKIVKFLKAENKEYSVYFFLNFEDFNAMAQELTAQMETEFAIVGDDLTLSNFLNNVRDISKIKLGIIPLTKHDDFANYIGIDPSPLEAIKTILNGKLQPVDFMAVNNQVVLNSVLVGASVELYEIYSQCKFKSALTKKLISLKNANKIEDVELVIDNKTNKPKTELVYELSVANGGLLNGKHINPLANVKDGLFNLCYSLGLEDGKKKSYILKFNSGEQIYSENAKQFWLTSVSIKKTEGDIKAMIDGDIKTYPELNISIVENGLKIYL